MTVKIDQESNSDIQTRRPRSLWWDTWQSFIRHRTGMVGALILLVLIVGAVVGPFVYSIDPNYIDIIANTQAPTLAHPFGTDNLGRDMLARTLVGGRVSLAVGLIAMLVAISLGTLVGLLAGYFGNLDDLLMRLTEMFMALPALPLILVITMLFRETLRAVLGAQMGLFWLIVVVIGILNWMGTARVVRAQVLAVKNQEFVTAAVSVGVNNRRILLGHILPNVLSPVIVAATFGVAAAILTESTLSFLGLGFSSDFPTWGRLLLDGSDYVQFAPWLVIFPGLTISLTVLSVNTMGDALRDALDPKTRKV